MPLAGRVWYQVFIQGKGTYVSYYNLASAIRFADIIGITWLTVLQDTPTGYRIVGQLNLESGLRP